MAAPEIACERPPTQDVSQVVEEGAKQSGLDTALVRAVVPEGIGVRSLRDVDQRRTRTHAIDAVGPNAIRRTDPYDPKQNVAAGTRLLKQLLEQYGGDLPRALGAYNAGPAQVEKWGGVPPIPETRQYVEGILSDLTRK